jgi:hypothetical protein
MATEPNFRGPNLCELWYTTGDRLNEVEPMDLTDASREVPPYGLTQEMAARVDVYPSRSYRRYHGAAIG